MNKKIRNLFIFKKLQNNKSKSIIFNTNRIEVGKIKYLPPISQEWKNNVCLFNYNNSKNLPSNDINIITIITAYFNLYFKNKFILQNNKLSVNRISLNHINISKPEISHTNNKVKITIYAFNREKLVLLKKIIKLKQVFLKTILKMFKYKDIINIKHLNKRVYKEMEIMANYFNKRKNLKNNLLEKNVYKHLSLLRKKWQKNHIIYMRLQKQLILLRRFKLRFDLNKLKFEELFLLKLGNIINRFYNKKVEFSIINLKSFLFNSDIFTKMLTLRIRAKRTNVLNAMQYLLNKSKLPQLNRII
jgi:hypothetical protein